MSNVGLCHSTSRRRAGLSSPPTFREEEAPPKDKEKLSEQIILASFKLSLRFWRYPI